MQYTKAVLLAHSKEVRDDGAILELVIWQLPRPVPPCTHAYKYRLFFGTAQDTRVRYDNERGKGDHKHLAGVEHHYPFVDVDTLLDDFERDVAKWSPP
jgi:hypothetical protein